MIYSCKPLFEKIKAQVGAEIDSFPIEDPPTVCIITTGEDEPSARYVRNKLRDFEELGIVGEVKNFFLLSDILDFLDDQKKKPRYDGIIVQRPILVKYSDPKYAAALVTKKIHPGQDIDGVLPGSGFVPPSVRGLDLLLHEWDYDPAGKTAVVIGRGDVGRPVADYLLSRDATVTICHSKTKKGDRICTYRNADIVVGAAGLKYPIYPYTRRYNGVLIDYGITKDEDGKLHGDIDPMCAESAKYQTSVPGGMGLMVRAGLLMNIVGAYKRRRGME